MKVLVAEDEKKIASYVAKGLREEGFDVEVVHGGAEAAACLMDQPFDAAVLDIMLPGRDGLDVLRGLRRAGRDLPVILLTARGRLEDRIEGLNLGADDYLVKPVFIEELAARLHAVIRRSSGRPASLIRIGDLALDLPRREVSRGGDPVGLTPREFRLLEVLAGSPGRVFSRTSLCERVWDYHFDPATNLVDVYIKRLRRKLDDGHEPKLIETVRGVGYRLAAIPPASR
jgi:DNA-binding response OmpR family regulator